MTNGNTTTLPIARSVVEKTGIPASLLKKVTTKGHQHAQKPYIKIDRKVIADPLDYEIVSDGSVAFTKDFALSFLQLKVFEGERLVREQHVQQLFDEYKSGRFLWQNVTLASAFLDGKQYRINGQHTAWMRTYISDAVHPKVRNTVYKVKSSDQLRALYSSFDRGTPRTATHLGTVLLLDTSAARGLPHSYLTQLITGFKLWDSKAASTKVARTPIAELCAHITKLHPKLFNTVGRFYSEHYSDAHWIKRASVIGAMFATFDKAPEDAIRFWTPVLTAIGLPTKSDVRWQLRHFIETHSVTVSKGGVSQNQLLNVCLNAWNYWRSKEMPSRLRTPASSDRPKVK